MVLSALSGTNVLTTTMRHESSQKGRITETNKLKAERCYEHNFFNTFTM